jgi:hypothetical protein
MIKLQLELLPFRYQLFSQFILYDIQVCSNTIILPHFKFCMLIFTWREASDTDVRTAFDITTIINCTVTKSNDTFTYYTMVCRHVSFH